LMPDTLQSCPLQRFTLQRFNFLTLQR